MSNKDNSEIITMSLDEALPKIINKDSIEFILKNVISRTGMIETHYRPEGLFFRTLYNVVNSEKENIKLIRQFKVGRYFVDAAIIEMIDNCGDYAIDKDSISAISLFEFDEEHHKESADKIRMDEIIKILTKEYDSIDVYRIPADKSNIFLKYAIPYYAGIETSYSYDKMSQFIYYRNLNN